MAVTWNPLTATWQNFAAGGTEIDADNLNDIKNALQAIYQLPNAAGDLIYGSAADTLERLAIGASDEVLSVNSSALDYRKIVNAMVDAAAAIVGSKLLPARVATTVAGLGTAADGAFGMIRAGSTPYAFVKLVYDATYTKWVSDPFRMLNQTGAPTTTSTSFAALSTSNFFYPAVRDFEILYNAGLRLEFATFISLQVDNAANTVTFAISGEAYDDADTTGATVFTDAAQVSHTGDTSATFENVDWTLPTYTAPTEAHLFLTPRGKVSAGTGTFRNCSVWARWVSA